MLKKIIACLLILTFVLCAVSCGKNDGEAVDAPEDMKSATVDGEPFDLFVPMTWLSNTLSGISSASYPYEDGVYVSARFIKTDLNIDLYQDSVENELKVKGYIFRENGVDSSLGNRLAKKMVYEYASTKTTSICAEVEGGIITLNLYCPASSADSYKEDFEQIRTNFRFHDRVSADDEVIINKDTPAGMKLASNPEIEYRFYVPVSWKCSPSTGASDAYYPESERTNVVVTSYIPPNTGRISVEEYFRDCSRQYKESLDGYTLLNETPEIRKNPVEDINMYCYTFTATANGHTVKIMQAVFAFNQSFYTITYTALEGKFDEHLNDFYKILDSFCFM